ncbi:hypothetical protein CLV58_109220 [Spirosoma oryzae]|uniref:Uncharacterized protein n=1 Tax=Spirosoma oryzae TaxID=1469603 RepID=A0A2T0SYQ5_9BACT|nr:hypothetical protein [Spirosoma oryzae]PRY38493.1 hypothetical protein CLV58_109220 [Spirosoma oryzae]
MTDNKLRVKWSKREKDFMGYYPLGISTKSDLHYLFWKVINDDLRKELEERGYDLTTLKFEVTVDPTKRPDRFPTLLAQSTNGSNR